MEETQYGLPLLVANFEGTSAQGLKRIRFQKGKGKEDYRERWLQGVASGGTYVTIDQLLAHEDEWYAAIEDFMAKVTDALKDQ